MDDYSLVRCALCRHMQVKAFHPSTTPRDLRLVQNTQHQIRNHDAYSITV